MMSGRQRVDTLGRRGGGGQCPVERLFCYPRTGGRNVHMVASLIWYTWDWSTHTLWDILIWHCPSCLSTWPHCRWWNLSGFPPLCCHIGRDQIPEVVMVWELSQLSSLGSYLPFRSLVILVVHIVTRGCKEPQDKAKIKMVKYFSWLLAVCSQDNRRPDLACVHSQL